MAKNTLYNNIFKILRKSIYSLAYFMVEYAYIINKPPHLPHPYSFGWQQETASHLFQLFISTSNRILDFSHYTGEYQENILEGKFFLGFNLNKKLWIKKMSL